MKNRFQAFAFKWVNLHRYDPAGAGSDPNTRITAVTAVKYAVLASKPDSDSSLQIIAENLSAFVGAAPLTDDDRGVRRAAVQTLSGRGLSLAHTRPRSTYFTPLSSQLSYLFATTSGTGGHVNCRS